MLHQRVHKLQLQVAGAKKQMDDPEELARLEKELASASAESTSSKPTERLLSHTRQAAGVARPESSRVIQRQGLTDRTIESTRRHFCRWA